MTVATERVARCLREAAERNDTDRMEFWAAALEHLSRPIPEYVSFDGLTQHLLPHREPAPDMGSAPRPSPKREH